MTPPLSPWQEPERQPDLLDETVHLWRFPLESEASLVRFLNTEERLRADRLRNPDKAREFVAARARLRQILAGYLGKQPQDLNFHYSRESKPALEGEPFLSFNLAHAGRWGLCALARRAHVGVDIERIDPQLNYKKLAEHFFSAAEQAALKDAGAERGRRVFFRLWTRKEAWLKGVGSGFSTPEQALAPVHLEHCSSYDGNWWLRTFPVSREHIATLASRQRSPLVLRWHGSATFFARRFDR